MSAPTTPFGKTPTQILSYRDDSYIPRRSRITSTVGLGISATVAVCCVLVILGRPMGLVILAAVAGAAATIAAAIITRRRWLKTSVRPAAMRQAVAAVVGQPLPAKLEHQAGRTLTASRYERGTLTTPGPARRVVLNARYLAMLDPARLETITAALSRLEGIQYKVEQPKKNKPGRYIFTPKPAEKAVKLSRREQVEKRMTDAARDVFGADARAVCTWDKEIEDHLTAVDITGIKGIDFALSGRQNQAGARLLSQLKEKNFKYAAFPDEDRFALFRPTPLPAVVMPPATPAPMMADHRAYERFQVSLGVGPNGAEAFWRPAADAHLLIIGGTGGGKTICEHGVIQQLTQAGWRVWGVDGKRVEFLGYKAWRNVEFLASRIDAQIRLIHLAHETMEERYSLIESGKIRAEELDPIALVIDEVTALLAAVAQRYAETKTKGMPAKPPVLGWLANLGRLARSAKIHLVFGMQRPDTTIIDGELRDNFGARISLGPLKSAEGSRMMWDNYAIGCQVPPIKGRAVSLIDGVPTMIQATYNANPDTNHRDYHSGMIAAMTPPIEIYTRKQIQPPVPTITDDESGPQITWENLLDAALIDSTGQKIEIDPIASEESRRFRAQIRTVTKKTARPLQPAESLEAGLALFPAPGTQQGGGLTYGGSVAKFLAHRYPAPQSPAQDSPEITREPQPNGPVAAETWDAATDTNAYGQPTFTTTAAELEPGQYATLEQIGAEIMISEIYPNDDGSYLVAGLDDDGQEIAVDVPADSVIHARLADEDADA